VKQKIIINSDSYETRIAILEDGELAELLVERTEQRRHVGDIYKGRVNAVLPGMQAAFVDLGLPKTGFLHASDLAESLSNLDDISDLDGNGDKGRRRRAPVPKIEDHLKKGQEILVQITKESIGTKGPRVTQQVSLPGRFCVLMPASTTSASRAASRTAASASVSRPSSATSSPRRRPDRAHRR
jgi:ribonuclease G